MKSKLFRSISRLPRRPEWGNDKLSFLRSWAGSEPTRKMIISALLLGFVVLIQRADFSVAQRIEDGIRYVITAKVDYTPVLQRLSSISDLADRIHWPLLPVGSDAEPDQAASADGQTEAGADTTELAARVKARGLVLPLTAEVTSGFGLRLHPVFQEERMHTGIDLGAPVGTPIAAALDGIVSAVGEDEVLGKTITVNHGDGIETVYAHCSEIGAQAGQYVRQGDQIAYVGETGQSDGPHLHFEVKVDGTAIDPAQVLDN